MMGTGILDLVVKGETYLKENDYETRNSSSYSSLGLWQLTYLQFEISENHKISI